MTDHPPPRASLPPLPKVSDRPPPPPKKGREAKEVFQKFQESLARTESAVGPLQAVRRRVRESLPNDEFEEDVTGVTMTLDEEVAKKILKE